MLPIVIRPASDRILLSEVLNAELVSPDGRSLAVHTQEHSTLERFDQGALSKASIAQKHTLLLARGLGFCFSCIHHFNACILKLYTFTIMLTMYSVKHSK